MKKFIRSSSRTKPDPLYYKRKIDSMVPKRNDLLDRACAIEEAAGATTTDVPSPREAKLLRLQADRLSAKIRWAMTSLVVAQRMQKQK